jgi:hypothetical protein
LSYGRHIWQHTQGFGNYIYRCQMYTCELSPGPLRRIQLSNAYTLRRVYSAPKSVHKYEDEGVERSPVPRRSPTRYQIICMFLRCYVSTPSLPSLHFFYMGGIMIGRLKVQSCLTSAVWPQLTFPGWYSRSHIYGPFIYSSMYLVTFRCGHGTEGYVVVKAKCDCDISDVV